MAAAGLGAGIRPNTLPLGIFENNVAHSGGRYGLRIYQEYNPTTPAVFRKMQTWRNQANGATWGAGTTLSFENFVFADNARAGFEFASAQGGYINGDWSLNQVRRSLFVGATPTFVRMMDSGSTAFGIFGPAANGLTFDDVVFAGYNRSNTWALRACAKCETFTNRDGGWEVRFRNIVWDNSPNRAYWRWAHESTWVDLDGTLTDTADDTSVTKPVSALPASGILRALPACVSKAGYGGGFGGRICPGHLFRSFGVNSFTPEVHKYKDLIITLANATDRVPWLFKRKANPNGWMALLPVGFDFMLRWDLTASQRQDLNTFTFRVAEFQPGERMVSGCCVFSDCLVSTHTRPPRPFSPSTPLLLQTFGYNFLQLPDHLVITGPSGTIRTPSAGRPLASANRTVRHGEWFLDDEFSNGYWMTAATWTDNRRAQVTSQWTKNMCPATGCPVERPCQRSRTVTRETFTRRWSDSATWTAIGRTGGKPTAGTNVTIPWQYHVLLDEATPALTNVWVEGRLTFEDKGAESTSEVVLSAAQVIVRHEGRLTVGSLSAPYEGNARIRLLGDKRYRSLGLGQTEIPAKSLVVFGEVRMVSAQTPVDWIKLGATASAGSRTLVLAGAVDWVAGQSIVISATRYLTREAENVTIASVSTSGGVTTLSLNEALRFTHHAATNTYGLWNVTTAAEVGLLSRNIVIEGADVAGNRLNGFTLVPTEDESYGGRVIVTRDAMDECVTYEGGAYFQGVAFHRMGAHGLDFDAAQGQALAFRNLGSSNPLPPAPTSHSVQRCSFGWLHHGAIGVAGGRNILVDSNVVSRPVGSGIRLDAGTTACNVTSNLVVNMLAPAMYKFVERANVALHGGITVRTPGNLVADNVVGGSEREGYLLYPEPCASASKRTDWYSNNEAHTTSFGFYYEDLVGGFCAQLNNARSWKSYDAGFFASIRPGLQINNFVSIDSHIGFMANVYSPAALSHVRVEKTVNINNALIVGVDATGSCAEQPSPFAWRHTLPAAGMSGVGRAGIVLTTFMSLPPMPLDKAPPWDVSSYPAISGLTRLNAVTFANFGPDACNRTNAAIMAFEGSGDAMHPVHLSNTTLVNVDEDSKVKFFRPNPGQINQDDCVDQACDGQKQVLLVDLDQSFTGLPRNGKKTAIFPAAEFMFPQETGTVVPIPMLTRWNGTRLTEADIAHGRGIARIVDENDNAAGPCVWKAPWLAWRCHSDLQYRMLVIESMDWDTELRRLSAVAILSRGTSELPDPTLRPDGLGVGGNKLGNGAGYMNLIAGPMDHGWVSGTGVGFGWRVRGAHISPLHLPPPPLPRCAVRWVHVPEAHLHLLLHRGDAAVLHHLPHVHQPRLHAVPPAERQPRRRHGDRHVVPAPPEAGGVRERRAGGGHELVQRAPPLHPAGWQQLRGAVPHAVQPHRHQRLLPPVPHHPLHRARQHGGGGEAAARHPGVADAGHQRGAVLQRPDQLCQQHGVRAQHPCQPHPHRQRRARLRGGRLPGPAASQPDPHRQRRRGARDAQHPRRARLADHADAADRVGGGERRAADAAGYRLPDRAAADAGAPRAGARGQQHHRRERHQPRPHGGGAAGGDAGQGYLHV